MKHDANFDGRPIRLSVTTKQIFLDEAINERLNYVISMGVLSYSRTQSLTNERFHVKSITQKPDHLQFGSNFTCLFTSMIEATVPNFRKTGQVFLVDLPKNGKLTPKIALDRYVASLFDQ